VSETVTTAISQKKKKATLDIKPGTVDIEKMRKKYPERGKPPHQ
jgi:hypothetical protein